MNRKKSKFASSLCAILMAATFFFLPFTEVRAAESASTAKADEQNATTKTTSTATATEINAVMTESSTVVEIPSATAKPIPPAETSPLSPVPMAANGNGSGEGNQPTPTPGKDYRYNVTISFGYFSFVYDWGVWDSDSFSYKASPSSAYPSAHTTPGNPGWYSFDGVMNKISIECKDTFPFSINVEYHFSVAFESVPVPKKENTPENGATPENETTAEKSPPLYPGITMELYSPIYQGEPAEWIMQVSKDVDPNQTPIPLKKVDANDFKVYSHYQGINVVKQDFYVSFGGLPIDNTDKQFSSTQMQEIGNITLTVGKPVLKQAPIEPAG